MISSRASELPTEVRLEYPFSGHTIDLPAAQPGPSPSRCTSSTRGVAQLSCCCMAIPWSFYYRNVVHRLVNAGFRCIVPDHIGCGLSDKPSDYPYTLERRIEDVAQLVDHLGIQSFSLVVHDWGGAIGLGLAGRRPQAVQKIVALNTAAFRSRRIPLRIALLKLPLLGQWMIRGLSICRPGDFDGGQSPLATTYSSWLPLALSLMAPTGGGVEFRARYSLAPRASFVCLLKAGRGRTV